MRVSTREIVGDWRGSCRDPSSKVSHESSRAICEAGCDDRRPAGRETLFVGVKDAIGAIGVCVVCDNAGVVELDGKHCAKKSSGRGIPFGVVGMAGCGGRNKWFLEVEPFPWAVELVEDGLERYALV